jgi:hypothetical protein
LYFSLILARALLASSAFSVRERDSIVFRRAGMLLADVKIAGNITRHLTIEFIVVGNDQVAAAKSFEQ